MTIDRIERGPVDEERMRHLRDLFPEIFADGRVDTGRLTEMFDGRAAELVHQEEHYGLSWPGKRAARLLATKPPIGTLLAAPGEGVVEATTRNALIVGDNLEVLRLLQKSYAGRVKLIYIDPPYNTGKDLIYKDDFSDPVAAYLEASGQADFGGLLTSNPRSGGRFHSRWLSMMLPRLSLARSLLSDDGLLAVSIDDNEAHALRLLLDEIFGEQNFVAQVVWSTEGHTDNQYDIKITHEYILLYARDAEHAGLGAVVDPNTRAESNLWKGFAENSVTKNGPTNPASEICLPVGFPCSVPNLDLPRTAVSDEFFQIVQQKNRVISREITKRFGVDYPVRLDPMRVRDGVLAAPCRVFSGWANRNKLLAFIEAGCRPLPEAEGASLKFYLSDRGVIYYRRERAAARNIVSVWQKQGTTEKSRAELERLGIHFQYPKPVELIQYLIRVADVRDNELVLDFFAGSGTTGEAVLRTNRDDGLRRRFILVQLPERIGTTPHKTIADITKARLHSVAAAMSENSGQVAETKQGASADIGFRVFYEGKSNVQRWVPYEGDAADLPLLYRTHDGLVSGWKAENLLIEVMLLEGYPLDSSCTQTSDFLDNVVYVVEHPHIPARLLVCLDGEVSEGTVDKLSDFGRDTFVCLESAMSDALKLRIANALHRVKTL